MSSLFSNGPLVVESKVSLVRQRLSDAIINGELKPGDRLVLDEIAKNLGVSKIPLREALSSLEGAGLVVQTPHTGPRVAPLPFHELRGIYLLREEVETLAVRLGLPSLKASDIAQLRGINDRMKAQLSNPDAVLMSDLNGEFHLTIARATSYQTIVETVSELLLKVRRYRSVVNRLAANWSRAVDEHDVIVAALEKGDLEAATAATRSHVLNQRQLEIADELSRTELADG